MLTRPDKDKPFYLIVTAKCPYCGFRQNVAKASDGSALNACMKCGKVFKEDVRGRQD